MAGIKYESTAADNEPDGITHLCRWNNYCIEQWAANRCSRTLYIGGM
jgi:hypothetical protein